MNDAGTVVGSSRAHESAHLHVSGEARYTDDIAETEATLHAALGLSPLAHGRLLGIDLELIRRQPGVVAVLTAQDIPGENNCGSLIHDDPILAEGKLRYLGQPVFAVVAASREQARRAAALAKQAIQAEALPPVLTALEAHALGQYVVPPMQLSRGDAAAALAAAPHRLDGEWSVGGQEHFYLEGQIAYALPQEDRALLIHSSTQHPSEMQQLVAHMLGWSANQVQLQCRRMGGGFGGKESQSGLFACIAALAAQKLQRPVKLRLDRDDDFLVTGRRHGFDYRWRVGYDDAGRILAAEVELIANCGHSADLSAPVMTRALCHFDNAYWLPNVALHGYCAKTNTQSNTAFRGFGGPQGALAIEMILDTVARRLGLDPLLVRQRNFYHPDPTKAQDLTPYGQRVEDNILQPLTARLLQTSAYAQRRAKIQAFNAHSPVLKKGIALTPVKFGISFNVVHLNQAGALLHVYLDGSVLVNHGGTEMGQGLNTKVAQVVAQELGLPLAAVRASATDTQKVANTSATAASTGADMNGKAAQDAAARIKARLVPLAAELLGCAPEALRFADGLVRGGDKTLAFAELVKQAYLRRIQLWSEGFYATPGLHWDRARLQGKPFYYFAYGAAVAEVIVDTLSGEHRILRADLLHDVGSSLNPAIDIGQIEGAFVQGAGWLTSEELVWQGVGPRRTPMPSTAPQGGDSGPLGRPGAALGSGKLLTHAPSTYKIPTANDSPPLFNTALFDAPNRADSVHRSKAVGEPPLLLGFAVLLAIKDAVAACGPARCDPLLLAPATAEAVLRALDSLPEER